jgi:hypothetical protein
MHRALAVVLAMASPVMVIAEVSAARDHPEDQDPAAVAVRDAPAPSANTRPAARGAYIGFGYGPALLSSTRGGGAHGSSVRVRVGVTRSSRVAFGLEGGLSANEQVQLGSYGVAATVFPWERLLYVRGGVGLTTFSFRDHPDERGANVLVGTGLALGGARGATLTVNVDAQYHRTLVTYGTGAQAATSVSTWLGVEWR